MNPHLLLLIWHSNWAITTVWLNEIIIIIIIIIIIYHNL
jgi:hypothetical protein